MSSYAQSIFIYDCKLSRLFSTNNVILKLFLFKSPFFRVIWKTTEMFADFQKKKQLFRENKFQIWPSITFRVVFWIASKKLGLISSAFWPKCISTHWLETWIEIYCLNFNNFCSNWEGRGAVWTTPPTGEVKTMEFRGGGSVTNR